MEQTLHTRPLYLQVRDILIDRLNAGAWRSGDILPNEHRLAAEFHVSVGTIRKAVEILVAEHVLARRQGRGTFIVDRSSADYEEKYDHIRGADGSSLDWEYRILALNVANPSQEEMARLELRQMESRVLRIIRQRCLQGRLVKHEQVSIALDQMPTAPDFAEDHPGLAKLAHACRVILGSSTETVSVEIANQDWSSVFHINTGTPLLKLDRIARNSSGLPVEWRLARCHLVDEIYYTSTS